MAQRLDKTRDNVRCDLEDTGTHLDHDCSEGMISVCNIGERGTHHLVTSLPETTTGASEYSKSEVT